MARMMARIYRSLDILSKGQLVERHIGGGQIVLLTELVDLDHVDEVVDLVLDHVQADVGVQLGE